MLVKLQEILDMAQKGGYGVPAFNVYNLETLMGAAEAACEARAPVILQIYPRLFREGGLTDCAARLLSPAVVEAAEKSHVPVCFHLDHGPSELEVMRALAWGASGIMIDASQLPYEENVEMTGRIVRLCGELGIGVEGELGHVGSVNDSDMDAFTDAGQAAEFVKETGVACLAVLVGNAHGRYKKPPKLDIDKIHDIYEAANHTPLVLHGGSGISDDQIRLAVKAGIRKMNFATDICYTFQDAVQAELESPDKSIALDLFMKRPVKAVKEFCLTKIKLLGAEGRA